MPYTLEERLQWIEGQVEKHHGYHQGMKGWGSRLCNIETAFGSRVPLLEQQLELMQAREAAFQRKMCWAILMIVLMLSVGIVLSLGAVLGVGSVVSVSVEHGEAMTDRALMVITVLPMLR